MRRDKYPANENGGVDKTGKRIDDCGAQRNAPRVSESCATPMGFEQRRAVASGSMRGKERGVKSRVEERLFRYTRGIARGFTTDVNTKLTFLFKLRDTSIVNMRRSGNNAPTSGSAGDLNADGDKSFMHRRNRDGNLRE